MNLLLAKKGLDSPGSLCIIGTTQELAHNLKLQSKVTAFRFDTEREKSQSQSQNLIPFSKVSVPTFETLSLNVEIEVLHILS